MLTPSGGTWLAGSLPTEDVELFAGDFAVSGVQPIRSPKQISNEQVTRFRSGLSFRGMVSDKGPSFDIRGNLPN